MMIKNIRFKRLNEPHYDDYKYRSDMLDNLKAMLCIVGVLLALFTVWGITP